MNWIPVSERLPEEGQDVLIFAREGICSGPTVCAASFEKNQFSDSGYSWRPLGVTGYEWEPDYSDKDVTHWMPIPEPPK